MSVQLAPDPILRFFDNNNNPLNGGQLYTYQAGTSTPVATYTDNTGSTPNTNPIVLNARGEASVWLASSQAYKLVLEDANGNLIWSQDQIPGGGVGAQSVNTAQLVNGAVTLAKFDSSGALNQVPMGRGVGNPAVWGYGSLAANGITTVSTSETLPNSVAGGAVIFAPLTATITDVLPAAANVPAGLEIQFTNSSAYPVVLNTGGTGPDNILIGLASSQTVTFMPGDTATLLSNGLNGYSMMDGSLSLKYGGTLPFRDRSNLKISYTGTSGLVSVSANSLTLATALGSAITLTGVSLSATSGAASGVANSLDAGNWAYSTQYYLFVIYNPTTQTPGLLWSLSATAPTLPSGYTYFVRIGGNFTQSATNYYFLAGKQVDRVFQPLVQATGNVTALTLLSSGVQGSVTTPTWVSVSLVGKVLATAVRVGLVVGAQSSNSMTAPNANYGAYNSTVNPPPCASSSLSGSAVAQAIWMTLETANVYFASTAAAGFLALFGWEDNL